MVQQQQALLNVKNDFFKTILAMVMSAVREHAVGAGVMCSPHDRSALTACSVSCACALYLSALVGRGRCNVTVVLLRVGRLGAGQTQGGIAIGGLL